MALQHLRTGVANKRPIPTLLSAGQLAVNTNEASPALFFKDSNGDLVKVGPVHIGTSAPNSSPASTAATALVTGATYQILTVGTSDFTLVGASTNTVGTIFTATGTTTGDGTVSGQQGVEKGEMWLDNSGGLYILKIYDGTAWRSTGGSFVDTAGGTMTGDLVMNDADIVFEGATADDFETTLTATDPTADNQIVLPDVSGTVVTTGDTGSVTSTMISNGTIVDGDINASAAIGLSKLATGALPSGITVASTNITNGTIVNEDINATAAIDLSKLATGALPSGITVASANITDGAITNADINASAAIDLTKLSDGALPSGVTVASANITNHTIVNDDINASAAIDLSKLATGSLPSAITVASSNIVDGTITNADISTTAAIGLSKLATGALPTGISVSSTNITDGTIVNGDISTTAAIGLSKLATGALPSGITIASANIVDGTIANADISSSAAIGLSKLATGALPSGITVASTNIVNGTIVDADVSSSAAIGLSKLATGALPSGITVASANITDGTIVDADVNASAAIAGTKISPDFGSQHILTTGEVRPSYIAVNRNNTFGGSRLSVNGKIHAEDGIFFGGNYNTNETMDEYEDGTFSPTLSGLASNLYIIRMARYVKVGRLVSWMAEIYIYSNSDTSTFSLSGLPFAVVDTNDYPVYASINDYNVAENNMRFYQYSTSVLGRDGSTSSLQYTELDNNTINMGGHYVTS